MREGERGGGGGGGAATVLYRHGRPFNVHGVTARYLFFGAGSMYRRYVTWLGHDLGIRLTKMERGHNEGHSV